MDVWLAALVGSVIGALLTLLSFLPHLRRVEKDNAELREVIQAHALERAFGKPGRMQTDLLPGETPAHQPRGMWAD